MSVRAVTPRVVALRGHLQFDGYRDADGVDLVQDSRWDEVDPSGFYPDERLNDLHRGSHVRPVRGARRGHAPMNEHASPETGLDGRLACSPSSPTVGGVSSSTRAGEPSTPLGSRSTARPCPSSPARASVETQDEQSRLGIGRDGS